MMHSCHNESIESATRGRKTRWDFFLKLQFDLQVVVVEFHISFTLSLESFGIVHVFGFNIECCLTSTDIV